jgi:hypothetical protein
MADRLFVGTRKGLFVVVRTGGRWQVAATAHLGVPCPSVAHDPRDGALYAGLGHGHFGPKLHRSRDGGASRLWCGTNPGGLFRSDDHGDTWQLVESLWHHPLRLEWFGGGTDHPAVHSICVDPTDGNHVVIGVSCGGVWVTRDGGATWAVRATGMWASFLPPEKAGYENQQDPHRVVQCAARPTHFWCQHHCGIWRSTDDCASWQRIERAGPSVFGFAVAVHPRDPEIAWFVPAISDERRLPVDGQLVVTRTRDGGRTFDVLRNGLPQEHAYDLTFRHGLDVDASGDRLAFGTTTGGLWTSEDQGDTWRAVPARLPPVYVVQFAR